MPQGTQISAGILVFRRRGDFEILLAHPGGPFWAKKDAGVWTIPKGLVESGDDIVAAARREFSEETNLVAKGDLIELAPVGKKAASSCMLSRLKRISILTRSPAILSNWSGHHDQGEGKTFRKSIVSPILICRPQS